MIDRETKTFLLLLAVVAVILQVWTNSRELEQASDSVASQAPWTEHARRSSSPTGSGEPASAPSQGEDPLYLEAGVYYRKGNQARVQGRYEDAVEAYTRSIELVESMPHSWNNRAWTYYLMGRYEEAVQDAQETIARTHAEPEFHKHALHTMASSQLALGEHELAQASIEKALELDPRFPEGRQLLEKLRNLSSGP